MLDTMTFTKILGGFCGSLLVFLLGAWLAEELYHVGGHGKDHAQGYVIDTGAQEVEVVEDAVPFAEVYAAADAAAGERLWRKCSACHKLEDGANGTGPHLYNIVDRAKASASGFGYSGALSGLGGNWTPENLSGFLENPKSYAPGTAMSYRGMPKVEDRANLIAYLASLGG